MVGLHPLRVIFQDSLSVVSGKGVLQVWPHLDGRRGLGVTLNMCSYGEMAVEEKVCPAARVTDSHWPFGHWDCNGEHGKA